ncbi:hypothetical protein TPHA_0O00940 [Tetrapisispora phaffii CBS 4417]|uniref:Nucleolar protein SWM2 n=1 Tax=Tetrapisispora phaffii (strain ATCC 24235 / CBS 4417 / NBRC 1672 / NRRL Y-8282 / UCD 70-5) TaxID=1071381 RepID=G8C1N5_TETPH|nr:hypothetical protein TPHA_0O00940 [Tetrapisispora phaffii CBS 4417]CCE66063.1 hypothetical protein TPHA_0O00940 [Tetrapisispora phaffii CBS 4417]
MSIDEIIIDDDILIVFLNNFTENPELLNEFSDSLSVIYESIAKNRIFSSLASSMCQQVFNRWENRNKTVDKNVLRCCLDMWLIIKGTDYDIPKFEEIVSNLIIEEADVSQYFSENDERLEFDEITNEVLVDPLSNLILEEVEVTEFVDEEENE